MAAISAAMRTGMVALKLVVITIGYTNYQKIVELVEDGFSERSGHGIWHQTNG
jgi:hypothetical protein